MKATYRTKESVYVFALNIIGCFHRNSNKETINLRCKSRKLQYSHFKCKPFQKFTLGTLFSIPLMKKHSKLLNENKTFTLNRNYIFGKRNNIYSERTCLLGQIILSGFRCYSFFLKSRTFFGSPWLILI